jgi:hypothetical protein
MKLKIMINNYLNGIQKRKVLKIHLRTSSHFIEISDTSKTKTFYITFVFSIWFNLVLR